MDFSEVVRRRRMVRAYQDRAVDRECLERILAAAQRGPSAGYSQGQYFVVITDPEIRQRLAELAGEPDYLARGFEPWISKAPVHVVVCVRSQDYLERYREPDKLGHQGEPNWPAPYWWVDGGAALMLLLLATVDEGLAAGFLGSHRLAGVGELLGIPSEVEPLGLVTIGHPAPDRPSSSLLRGRKPVEEVVRWGRWEQTGLETGVGITE